VKEKMLTLDILFLRFRREGKRL